MAEEGSAVDFRMELNNESKLHPRWIEAGAAVQAELAALREEFALPDISNAVDQETAAEVEQWGFVSKLQANQ